MYLNTFENMVYDVSIPEFPQNKITIENSSQSHGIYDGH